MTLEKAIEVWENCTNLCYDEETLDEAYHKGVEALKKAEKYKWHDLKKNPDDLPENKSGVLAIQKCGDCNICNKVYFSTNLYKVDKFKFADRRNVRGFYDYDSEYGYFEKLDVIAWKYIEPFESEVEE